MDIDSNAIVAIVTAFGAVIVAGITAITAASKKSVADLTATVNLQQTSINNQNGLIDDLKDSVKILKNENVRLVRDNTTLRQRIEQLEFAGKTTVEKLCSLEKENTALQETIAELKHENLLLEQENAALKLRIEQLENNKC